MKITNDLIITFPPVYCQKGIPEPCRQTGENAQQIGGKGEREREREREREDSTANDTAKALSNVKHLACCCWTESIQKNKNLLRQKTTTTTDYAILPKFINFEVDYFGLEQNAALNHNMVKFCICPQ